MTTTLHDLTGFKKGDLICIHLLNEQIRAKIIKVDYESNEITIRRNKFIKTNKIITRQLIL